MPVLELDYLSLAERENASLRRRTLRPAGLGCGGAAGSGIDPFVVVRGLHGQCQVFARAAAGVEPAPGQQPPPGVAIEAVPLALRVRPEADHPRPVPPATRGQASAGLRSWRDRKCGCERSGQDPRCAGSACLSAASARCCAIQKVRAWPRCRYPVGEGASRPAVT